MTTLQNICVATLIQHNQWHDLPHHIQDIVFPGHRHIYCLQQRFRKRLWYKRHKMDVFLACLDDTYTNLLPENTLIYSVDVVYHSSITFRSGDHIVVIFNGGKIHHGLIDVEENGETWMYDFSTQLSNDWFMYHAKIRKRHILEFFAPYSKFGIVQYPFVVGEPTSKGGGRRGNLRFPYFRGENLDQERRFRAVWIAKFMEANSERLKTLWPYNLLRRNCESFVILCMSGWTDARSPQVEKVAIIRRYLQRGDQSRIHQLVSGIIIFVSHHLWG